MPPCPGIIFPLSFTPAMRLNLDSIKSPIVPTTPKKRMPNDEIPHRAENNIGERKRNVVPGEYGIPPAQSFGRRKPTVAFIEAPQGLWGTGELGIFINGNTGTSCTFNGDQGNIRNYFREQGTF